MGFNGSTEFPDGSRLDQDPRYEDPLVYYVPATGWPDAIGFKPTPERPRGRAEGISLEVWPTFHTRLRGLTDAGLRVITSRVAPGATVRGHQVLAVVWPDFVTERITR
jgi:hypothetical protein